MSAWHLEKIRVGLWQNSKTTASKCIFSHSRKLESWLRDSWIESHIINFYHFSFFSFLYFFAFFGSFFVLFFRFWCYVDLSSLCMTTPGTKSLFMTAQSSFYTYCVTPTGRLATSKRQVFIYVKMTDRSYYFEWAHEKLK